MVSNGMLVCSFCLKKRYSRNSESLPLNHPYPYYENGIEQKVFSDAFEIFSDFCLSNSAFSDNAKRQKVFSIMEDSYKEYDTATYRCCSFVVRSGSYGVEGDITNRETNTITYRRNENEADVKSFRVVAYIPKDIGGTQIAKGILVFQSIATFGIKTITMEYFRGYLEKYGLSLDLRSVSVKAFFDKLIEQGKLRKVTLIKNNVSPNGIDNMLISTGRQEISYIRPNLTPNWRDKLTSIFQRADETSVYEIEDEDFDDISVQFEMGGRIRTVRLKNLERMSIIEDIPEGIVDRENDERLINHMIQTADEYKEKMVFNTGG